MSSVNADITKIDSFEADFEQSVMNEKQDVIRYFGHVLATKPQYALWQYSKPVEKEIYITKQNVTIIEPEIEQVIIRRIRNNFNFFKMIEDAKEIKKDIYITKIKDIEYTIKLDKNLIKSISYKDEFENNIIISFTQQIQNSKIDTIVFTPKVPLEYDIIRD